MMWKIVHSGTAKVGTMLRGKAPMLTPGASPAKKPKLLLLDSTPVAIATKKYTTPATFNH